MMSHTIKSVIIWTSATLLLTSVLLFSPQAQAVEFCETDGDYEPPSDVDRTVELSALGISLAIPENYRLMARQDGSVEILHPDDFEWLQCIASGGIGAHGYYYERIAAVTPDLTQSLEEQVQEEWVDQLIPYQANGLDGYITTSVTGYGVSFLGNVQGFDQLLEISVGCDCEVDVDALMDLLSQVSPLE